jgi:hypothetical protein
MTNLAIDLVTEQYRAYPKVYRGNESNVEDQLIPPILHALGWDTGNPKQVQTKIGIKGDSKLRPDFILFSKDDYFTFIEAKKVGNVRIRDHKEKISSYLKYSENVILTDGLRWYGFTDRNLEPMWTFHLLRSPREYCIEMFQSLHPFHESTKASLKHAYSATYGFRDHVVFNEVEKQLEQLDVETVVMEYILEKISRPLRQLSVGHNDDWIYNHLSESDVEEKLRLWAEDYINKEE